MKKLFAAVIAGGLILGMVASASAAPKVVFTDPVGDATAGGQAPANAPGGWDIAEGSIERAGANLEFTVTHGDMPPMGSMPEATRFLWNFNVGTTPYRLTVKSADLGKPDVVGGQTDERIGRADAQGHFRLEGECTTDASLPLNRVNCPVVGYYSGTFDPAAMSFTAVIPMKDLKAKPGSKIIGGGSNICIICWVSHVAERSVDATIIDSATQTVTYKVPK